MKRLLLLFCMVGLVACGGGSGGNGVSPRYVDTVGRSNAGVTGMVANSEYQVARYVANKLGDDAGTVNLSRVSSNRGAFVPMGGGTDYDKAYELVQLAGWLVSNDTTEDDIVSVFNRSDLDKNKIKAALKLLDDMYCFVGGSAQKTAERIVAHRAEFGDKLLDLQQKTEVFNLSDVEFVMAAASGSGGDEGGAKDLLTFGLDSKGQIDAVNHVALVKNGTELVRSESESAVFVRNNEVDNTFDVGQINGEGKVYTGNGVVLTYGREVGLKYSDFGQLKYDLHWVNGNESGNEKSYEPFAGGYKELRRVSPDSTMNFAGKAVGSVSGGDLNKNIMGDATLAFDDGTETLNMYFSDTVANADDTPWYDVKIVRNQSTNSITFTTDDELDEKIPENLRFGDFNNNVRTKSDYLVDGYNGEEYPNNRPDKGKLDIGYYGGRDGNIAEIAGVTQYVESVGGSVGEIRMNVGFGAIATE